MKKFTVSLALFILFALVMIALISLVNKKLVINSLYDPKLFKLGSIDTLLVGASDIEFSLNPEIIKNSCNVARPAENYFYSYYKIKFILQGNPQIKTIVLGFGYPGLTQASEKDLYGVKAATFYDRYFMLLDSEGRKTISSLDRYYIVNVAKFYWGVPVELYKQADLLWRLIVNKVDITLYPFYGGFQKDIDFFEKIPKQKVDTIIIRHYFSNDKMVQKSDILIDYLLKIVKMCKEKNIRLILLKTPLFKEYFEKIPSYFKKLNNDVLLRVRDINPDIECYDYNEFFLTDRHFIDSDHLSRDGADIFSAKLNKDLF